ncbi:MAG: acetylxylan esterase [Verrucomicrobiota bacterium]
MSSEDQPIADARGLLIEDQEWFQSHPYFFDPTHGYTLSQLLEVGPAPEPDGYNQFWSEKYHHALGADMRIKRKLSRQWMPGYVVEDVHFHSTAGVKLGGWLCSPESGEITRGIVVGHGYGGRGYPECDMRLKDCAYFFPCLRGISRSVMRGVPSDPQGHVIHGLHSLDTSILRGCVEDIWVSVSALQDMMPEVGERISYVGTSFAGGLGVIASAHDDRICALHVSVPTFGNFPLRHELECLGSGASTREFVARYPESNQVLAFLDSSVAATHVTQPIHIAAALFDPVVPPVGQFAIYNAVPGEKELFVLSAGHHDHQMKADEVQQMTISARRFLDRYAAPQVLS